MPGRLEGASGRLEAVGLLVLSGSWGRKKVALMGAGPLGTGSKSHLQFGTYTGNAPQCSQGASTKSAPWKGPHKVRVTLQHEDQTHRLSEGWRERRGHGRWEDGWGQARPHPLCLALQQHLHICLQLS